MVEELAKKPEPTIARDAGRPSAEDQQTLEAAKNAAIIGFAALNMTVVSLLGENCAATSAEREVAIESMQGMLEGMTPDTAKVVSKYLLPFQLGTALLSWGARVYRIKKEEADESGPGPSSGPGPEDITPPGGGNHREKEPESAPIEELPLEPVEQVGPDGNKIRVIPIEQLRRVDGTGLDSRE